MKLLAYREYDLCGDEFLKEEHDCLVGLTLTDDGTINLTYHPGMPDETDLGMPRLETGTTKAFLGVKRDGDQECYHISMMEFGLFSALAYGRDPQ